MEIDCENSPNKNDFLSIQRYNLEIKDFNQPLLVTKSKEKNMRGGQQSIALLVPGTFAAALKLFEHFNFYFTLNFQNCAA